MLKTLSESRQLPVVTTRPVFPSQGDWTCLYSQQHSPPLHQLGRIPDRDEVQVNAKKVTNYMNIRQLIHVPHCTTINSLTVDSLRWGGTPK